jgi:hypothetical protein
MPLTPEQARIQHQNRVYRSNLGKLNGFDKVIDEHLVAKGCDAPVTVRFPSEPRWNAHEAYAIMKTIEAIYTAAGWKVEFRQDHPGQSSPFTSAVFTAVVYEE